MDIDADAKTTPPISRSLSFTNGTHKRHSTATATVPPPPSMVVSYKECLKNHAASIGGHALDGCGEFMPSSSTNPTDPRSLKCAACGCHRNFHRREPQEPNTSTTTANNNNNPSFLNCIYSPSAPPPPPPPQLPHRGLNQSTSPSLSSSPSPSPSPISSPSPPPISHLPPSYNTSAPHMLLALGSAYSAPSDGNTQSHSHSHNLSFSAVKMENVNLTASAKKRYRTKFSKEQKEKMYSLSEKLGWRMQKGDDGLVQQFCNDIGVSRGVFKVWMHNNKNTFKKRSELGNNEASQNDEKMNVDHDAGNNAAAGFDSDTNNPNNSSNNLHVSLNGLSS